MGRAEKLDSLGEEPFDGTNQVSRVIVELTAATARDEADRSVLQKKK